MSKSMTWTLVIDFGTSYTVAVAKQAGRPPEVLEIFGERRVPSVILVEAGGAIVVGRAADHLASSHPERTLRAPKSRLGDLAPVVLDGQPYAVAELVAALLRTVHDEAAQQMGSSPTDVRLTHPATWSRPRLDRLTEAAALAGLTGCTLVAEPVAAALAFAAEVDVAAGGTIAVYDLGGGTFDTAVVQAHADGFVVLGRPGGDDGIGGDLFDELLFDHVIEQLPAAVGAALVAGADPAWRAAATNLRSEVRRAKETLSTATSVDVGVATPTGLIQIKVSRAEFEQLVQPCIDETIVLLATCVEQAGIDPNSLAAISLVGGSSRSPVVARIVQEAFPTVAVSRRGDPKASVALGAAYVIRAGGATETAAAPAMAAPKLHPAGDTVLVATGATGATGAASHPAPAATTPRERPPRGRMIVAAGAVLVTAVVAIVALATAGSDSDGSTASTDSVPSVLSSAPADSVPVTDPPVTDPQVTDQPVIEPDATNVAATAGPATDVTAAVTSAVATPAAVIGSAAALEAYLLPVEQARAALGPTAQAMASDAAVRALCAGTDLSRPKLEASQQYAVPGAFQVREVLALYPTAEAATRTLTTLIEAVMSCAQQTAAITVAGKPYAVELVDRSVDYLQDGSLVTAFDWSATSDAANAPDRSGTAVIRQTGRHVSTLRIDAVGAPLTAEQSAGFDAYVAAVATQTAPVP